MLSGQRTDQEPDQGTAQPLAGDLLDFRRSYLCREVPESYRNLIEQNLFWDKSDSHTFSDWLVPYTLGVGVEDLEEFYLGGFPDLSLFLERSDSGIEFQPEVFSQLCSQNLTEFGKKLKALAANRVWIDLGCGRPGKSMIPRLLAQAFGSSFYVGADLNMEADHIRQNEFGELGAFTSYFVKEDILKFLSQLNLNLPAIYFMAGVELMDQKANEKPAYVKALIKELDRVTKPNDLIIAGAGTPDFDFDLKHFRLIYADFYHEVFQRKRSWWPFSQ